MYIIIEEAAMQDISSIANLIRDELLILINSLYEKNGYKKGDTVSKKKFRQTAFYGKLACRDKICFSSTLG